MVKGASSSEARARDELAAEARLGDGEKIAVAGWLSFHGGGRPGLSPGGLRHLPDDGARGPRPEPRGALGLAVSHFASLGHHRFTIDPAVANERAVRSYAAVGFGPVGVMRSYERGRDGTWHDNLLMDLLADQLEPGSA